MISWKLGEPDSRLIPLTDNECKGKYSSFKCLSDGSNPLFCALSNQNFVINVILSGAEPDTNLLPEYANRCLVTVKLHDFEQDKLFIYDMIGFETCNVVNDILRHTDLGDNFEFMDKVLRSRGLKDVAIFNIK